MVKQSKKTVHKTSRGRPAGIKYGETIPSRFEPATVAAIDAWADRNAVSRSEAVRRLVVSGLKPQQQTSAPSDPPQGQYAVPPPGWALDELSKFLDAARENQFATFVRKKPAYGRLAAIDELFCTISRGWLNPADEIAALLLLRTHSAFRAAAGLAAGQAAEAYVLNRSVLENAAYALHLNRDQALRKIWLNRHVDAASLKACSDALSHRKVQKTVTAVNRHAGERFEKLYQRTIDFGGHPNERSVTGNMKMQKQQGRRNMLVVMQHDDGPALNAILKATAQCGLCSLEILQGVFNLRFELLGINAAMLELRRGL